MVFHALVFAAGAARAEPKPLPHGVAAPDAPHLDWRAPADCPERHAVLAQVAALVAHEDVSWARFQRIQGQIEQTAGGWSLVLEFANPGAIGKRVMQGGNCQELAEAAAVAIVLALRRNQGEADAWDVSAALDESEGTPALEVAAEPPRAALAIAPVEGTSDDRSGWDTAGHAMTTLIDLEGVLDPSTLGSAALGAALGFTLNFSRFSTGLYAIAFPSVTTRLSTDEGVAVGLWAGGLQGCRRWGRGFATCALVELGQIRSEGVGLLQAKEAKDLWAAPGASAGFTATPFDGFGITTRITAFHPLIRGQFRVDESEVVHRIPTFGFRATLGLDIPLQ